MACSDVSLHQIQSRGQCTHVVSPHERYTSQMLSPFILSSSPSLGWVMPYWNHMPSWIPRVSSHLVQSQQSAAGRGHCREEGLYASCVGSKYLHSVLSRVVVVCVCVCVGALGYVKSNPAGCIFIRLSLLQQNFEQFQLWESFVNVLLAFCDIWQIWYIAPHSCYRNTNSHCEHMLCALILKRTSTLQRLQHLTS